MDEKIIDYHKNIIQSSNINFLIGSGLSKPFLATLGNIEKNIEAIENRDDIEERVVYYCIPVILLLYKCNVS